MIVVGLTGSIGMGKSTTAALFAEVGTPVYDADAEVHRLYAKGGAAVKPVGAAFPGVVRNGAIDRKRLSETVLGDSAALQRLNRIVWPLMRDVREAFFERARAAKAEIVVLDIPLLFESGGDGSFDAVIVVSAPADIQRARVLARGQMGEAKFAAILAAQKPDAEKRARADFVIDTGVSVEDARRQVQAVLAALRQRGK